MARRAPSPADREITRLQTAWDATEAAYTVVLDRAYSLALPEAEVMPAEAALRAPNEARKTAYLDLLAALDARREGSVHSSIIAQSSPILTASKGGL